MKKYRAIMLLCIAIAILVIVNAGMSLFYSNGGESFYFTSMYGEEIRMYGDGLYAMDTYFKTPIHKGTDAVTLFIMLPLLLVTTVRLKKDTLKHRLLHLGILSYFMYNAISIAFSTSYNILFLSYILYFALTLVTTFIAFNGAIQCDIYKYIGDKYPHKSATALMILSGLSVFIWLMEVVNSLSSSVPLKTMGAGTTEPTFIIDMGIIAPLAFIGAYSLYKKRKFGYIITPTLLMLNTTIGIVVVVQSIFQYNYGVFLSISEFIGFVLVFIVTSSLAAITTYRIFKNIEIL